MGLYSEYTQGSNLQVWIFQPGSSLPACPVCSEKGSLRWSVKTCRSHRERHSQVLVHTHNLSFHCISTRWCNTAWYGYSHVSKATLMYPNWVSVSVWNWIIISVKVAGTLWRLWSGNINPHTTFKCQCQYGLSHDLILHVEIFTFEIRSLEGSMPEMETWVIT